MKKVFVSLLFLLVIGTFPAYSSEIIDQSQSGIGWGFWFDDTEIRWQEFIPTLNNLTAIEINITRYGPAGNVIVEIRSLDDTVLGQETILEADLTSSGWYKIKFSPIIDLTPGTKYRIYVYSDQDSPTPSNRYAWRGNANSPYNPVCENSVSGSWPDYDFCFKTYGLNTQNRTIAYVYSTDSTTANSYKSFLDGEGFPTTLIHQDSIVSGIFAGYGTILIGYETGSSYTWGDTAKVDAVNDSHKPILGLGFGGSSLYSELSLFIEWGQGGVNNNNQISVVDPVHIIFNSPNNITDSTITLYTTSKSVLEIYAPSKPEDVVLLGKDATLADYYPLIEEKNRYLLLGFNASPDDMTQTGKDLFENLVAYMVGVKDDLLGTWNGQGVYYRNSDTDSWSLMANPGDSVTCGDLDGDGKDDLIGTWSGQGGVWVKYSSTGTWSKLSSTASNIASGDMNGDGRNDFVGTWDGQGVYYKNSLSSTWAKIATPADLIAAGDLDGDGIDDLIGIWSGQGGVWVKYSSTDSWSKLSSTASNIASGDMNGDGKDDLLGTWIGQGVYYRDSDTGTWVKMATPADLIAAGDLDGDGIDDLIGIWSGQGGVWVKYSSTDIWSRLSSTASDIDAGRMRIETGSGSATGFLKLMAPIGGYTEGPGNILEYEDLSSEGPGGWNFAFQVEKNLVPQKKGLKIMMKTPGPGEPGFKCIEQKNLFPQERIKKKSRIRK